MKQHTYIAIDLKSFYASVECRERGLDPTASAPVRFCTAPMRQIKRSSSSAR